MKTHEFDISTGQTAHSIRPDAAERIGSEISRTQGYIYASEGRNPSKPL